MPLVLHARRPHGGPRRRSQEKKEGQHRDQLQDHGDGAEEDVVPCEAPNLALLILFGQPAQLEPPIMRQLAEPRAGDDDEGGRADDGH